MKSRNHAIVVVVVIAVPGIVLLLATIAVSLATPENTFACLALLLDTVGVAIDIANDLGLGVFNTDAIAISAICEALLSREVSIALFSNVLPGHIPQGIAAQIIGCVEASL